MSIRMQEARVLGQQFKYITDDNEEFFDLDEAIEHENKLKEVKPKPVVVYEFITSIQQAINMAAAEKRVVRFIWNGDNESIKKGIDDKTGCRLVKPSKESHDVAIVPEGINDFDFDEVK